jgi:serine/threonine protein kinase
MKARMDDPAPVLDNAREPFVDALQQLCYASHDFARRYEGWEVIGQGAFATVVKVSLMGETVALKILTNLNAEGKARFRSEFASTVRLNSPHLVRTYSAFDNGSIAWIEMEAVDGPNLEDELARRERENQPFSLDEALEIAIAVTAVVAEAHEHGIVHRDIKPANILLPRSRKPVAKLGDFGIARFLDAAKLTATGGFPGTPKWAAPEVFALRPQVGAAADVYSLSLCLFGLFTTNRYPWVVGEDVSPGAFMAAHLKTRPLRMAFYERGLPEEIDDIVARGLEKKPRDRPSAAELARSLRGGRSRWTSVVVVTEERGTAPSGNRRSLRRAALASACLLCLLLLGVVFRGGALDQTPDPVDSRSDSTGATVPVAPPVTQAAGEYPRSSEYSSESGGADIDVALRGAFIRLQNGGLPVSNVDVVLLDNQGQRHAYRLPAGLAAGETADVALAAFQPTPDATSLREARVTMVEAGVRRERRAVLVE